MFTCEPHFDKVLLVVSFVMFILYDNTSGNSVRKSLLDGMSSAYIYYTAETLLSGHPRGKR